MYKQAIIVRTDLKLSKGKLATQVAHASVESVHKSTPNTIKEWRKEGMKKLVFKITNLEELYQLKSEAELNNLVTATIKDAGHTEVKPGTTTCLAIGPANEQEIDKVTGKLKLL